MKARDVLLAAAGRRLVDVDGEGMPIGRFGPKTPLTRAGDELVFAYASRTRMARLKTWITGR